MVTSTGTTETLQPGQLLRTFHPFDRLNPDAAAAIEPLLERRRFRLGQTVLRSDVMPEGLLLLKAGVLRSLATDPITDEIRTIDLLQPGSTAGWCSILRSEPCEQLRASSDVELMVLPTATLRDLLANHETLCLWFQNTLPAAELYLLLSAVAQQEPEWLPRLQSWPAIRDQALVRSLPPGPDTSLSLSGDDVRWYASSGAPLGSPWPSAAPSRSPRAGAAWLRLVGLPTQSSPEEPELSIGIPPAPSLQVGSPPGPPAPPESPGLYALSPEPPMPRSEGRASQLTLARSSGPRDIPIAICTALANYFGVPINRDSLIDQVRSVLQRQDQLNLMNLGQILDGLGLRVVLSELPADRLRRASTPAVLYQQGHFALLDGIDEQGKLMLLEPELGPLRLSPDQLQAEGNGMVQLLLLQRKPGAKEQNFSWSWYAPFLKEHRRALIEVLSLSAVVNLLALVTPLGLQVLIDQVARQDNVNALLSISFVLLLASVVGAVLKTLRSYIFTETANRIDHATKSTILDQMVRLPQGFFDSRPVGQVLFYFNQLDRLRDFLVGQSLTTVVDFLFSLLYLAVLLAISVPLTIASLATLPLMLALTVLSNPLVKGQIKRSLREGVNTFAYLNESISGIQTIKAQNAENKTRWEFQNRYARFIGEDFKLKITRESLSNLAHFINELNGLVVIGVGIYLVMRNELTLGGFIAFRILSGYITRPLVQLTSTWQSFQQCTESITLVADVVDRPTEQSELEALNIPMPPLVGHVQFEAVEFRYEAELPLILHGVSLDVPAGSFVGLVGGSGSGKSTLLKLLPRFYRPSDGRVMVDGLDINKVELYSLRRQIGVVPQDTILFDGTVRDNLLLVKPDATAEELMRATRIACAHEFIMAMPKGYNSSVGERGAGLSGGQRQRLALARAVLQSPRLLILDEATSALDARTERQVCLNLLEAFRGRTVFFITHRLASVQPADCIVMMDKGAIMEAGTHRDLMRRQGWYYALFQSQNQEGGV